MPDIDFNIRAGNTLVGYATNAQFDAANTLASDQDHREQIKAGIAELADLFDRFREQQTVQGGNVTPEEKRALRDNLTRLTVELDRYVAHDYGIDPNDAEAFGSWKNRHQPFHWFAEFYAVMRQGGFNVVVGNPPYVEYKDIKETYTVRGFRSEPCGDLYAFCTERALELLRPSGRVGLIVPVSIFGTDGFISLQTLLLSAVSSVWVSCFANRPSQLFDGAQKRLTIVLGRLSTTTATEIFTSRYFRWKREEFDTLFRSRIHYAPPHGNFEVFPASLEKLGSKLEVHAFRRLTTGGKRLALAVTRPGQSQVYYTRKFGYFLAFLDFVPEITRNATGERVPPTELKQLGFASVESANAVVAVLSSSTFFWFWNILSDCRNLNRRDLLAFPFDPEHIDPKFKSQIVDLGMRYLQELRKTSRIMLKSGLQIETFDYAACKRIVDDIDVLLAQHYGLTNDELDYIINYDIKYRIGTAGGEK